MKYCIFTIYQPEINHLQHHFTARGISLTGTNPSKSLNDKQKEIARAMENWLELPGELERR